MNKAINQLSPTIMKTYPRLPFQGQMNVAFGPNPFGVKKFVMTTKVRDMIHKSIGSRPAESGGALYAKRKTIYTPYPFVQDFSFDKGLNTTRTFYEIDHDFVNQQNAIKWQESELDYVGQIHSHPYGFGRLSAPDMKYAHGLHDYTDLPYMIFPVVFTDPDGGFKIFVYLVGPDPKSPAYQVDYCVMDEAEYERTFAARESEGTETSEVETASSATQGNPEVTGAEKTEEAVKAEDGSKEDTGKEAPAAAEPAKPAEVTVVPATAETEAVKVVNEGETVSGDAGTEGQHGVPKINYVRIEDALSVKMLHKTKIIVIGCGGTYFSVNMFTRSGVKHFVFIDPDTVDDTNLCRQGYLPRQVGMKKVDALAEAVHELDPEALCEGYAKKVQELTFEEVEAIFGDADLIIAATDSSAAQAFMNKIALRYHLPTIWGGFYEKSHALEIFFYVPGVTPGCYNCALWPRVQYQKEYMEKHDGKEFRVSSACNTIFHSAILDAQMGMIAMAILHNKVEGKTFSGWFGDHFDRNFMQMKVNPAYESKLFDSVFESAGGSAYLFESVWQQIEPDAPEGQDHCADCHARVAGRGVTADETKRDE